MTLYNVHIYREMRLYFPGIEAPTLDEAARIAAGRPTAEAEYTEDCDGENLAALVDVAGDDDFGQSVTIDFQAEHEHNPADSHEPADIHQQLEQRRQVAVIWSIDDVQSVRPGLNDDQSWEVLQRCIKVHDCEVGFTWLLIQYIADDLFPNSEQGGGQ